MTDNRGKGRVRAMKAGTSPDAVTTEHAMVVPAGSPGAGADAGLPVAGLPSQALQVLTMAQRTAEEHIARADHQADKIRTDALAAAEEVARNAEQHAHTIRREADKVLSDARAAVEQSGREAQAHADETRRNADRIVADARAGAQSIAADAQANAENLRLQAQQRYDDVVGGLSARRAALQEQIESLERFDQEYRARLATFMQSQLRAMWVDQPQVGGLPDRAEEAGDQQPEHVEGAEAEGRIPAQRHGGAVKFAPVPGDG